MATQVVIEEIVLNIVREARKLTNSSNLCLAGGVALNCVAKSKLLKEKLFDKVFIQPASGYAGGSLGAALASYHLFFNSPRICSDNNPIMQESI